MLKQNLYMLRSLHRYSQEEVAEKIGISRQAYAKWESGATIPDIEKCALLAQLYGTTIDAMIANNSIDCAGATIPPAPKGKNIWGSVVISRDGQITLPKAVREKFALNGGEKLVVLSEDNEGIALVPAELFEAKMNKMMELASLRPEE